MAWEWIVVGYATYLAVVAAAVPRFARARGPTMVAAFVAWVLWAMWHDGSRPILVDALLPALILVVGYWLSGLFFLFPMLDFERRLLRVDTQLARICPVPCPWIAREYLELAYVLVYVVVPSGALTLALGGHSSEVPRFWAVVLLAGFASYGMLPWVQTRPPRAIETGEVAVVSSPLRRFNLAILERASNQVNTVPSGHAATAVAVALVVGSVMPGAGVVFGVVAASIAVATVIGRYHYAVDSLLGVLVGVGAWAIIRWGSA
jgi:PAP2 superfamily